MKTDYAKINVDCNDLEELIIALHELSYALYRHCYDAKAEYILQENKDLSKGQNAINFIENNADLTSATLRVIAEATGLLTAGFVNDDIAITAHSAGEE